MVADPFSTNAPAHLAFEARAKAVRMVLTDCDGVLTDTGVYYTAEGEVMKRFSLRDGMGVERLRDHGILTGIVTGERSPCVVRRAEKLGIDFLFEGVSDKHAHLYEIRKTTRLETFQLAYIGDDVNDLRIMQAIRAHGLVGAPADAMDEVLNAAHFRCLKPGGHGAFREFAEWILALRSQP